MKKYIFSIIGLSLLSAAVCAEQVSMQLTSNTKLVIAQGDITKAPVECIVNAANKELEGGAGVCGAIFNAAGWQQLQAACNAYAEDNNGIRCPVGQACITDSFNLKSRGINYIIHAVGPDCRIVKNTKQQDTLLASAYRTTLELADKNKITSLAFPFISSAIYAFPKERAAKIALQTITDYIKNHPKSSVAEIRMVLFSQEDFKIFEQTAKKYLIIF